MMPVIGQYTPTFHHSPMTEIVTSYGTPDKDGDFKIYIYVCYLQKDIILMKSTNLNDWTYTNEDIYDNYNPNVQIGIIRQNIIHSLEMKKV